MVTYLCIWLWICILYLAICFVVLCCSGFFHFYQCNWCNTGVVILNQYFLLQQRASLDWNHFTPQFNHYANSYMVHSPLYVEHLANNSLVKETNLKSDHVNEVIRYHATLIKMILRSHIFHNVRLLRHDDFLLIHIAINFNKLGIEMCQSESKEK